MDWGDFPPFCIVTGTVSVRGGETRKMTSTAGADGRRDVSMVKISLPAKRRGDSISAKFMKKLDRLRVLKTPFGSLVHVDHLPDVKKMIAEANETVRIFNGEGHDECVLWNCIVWEPLRGNRLTAVKAWLQGNPDELAQVDVFLQKRSGAKPSRDPAPPVAAEPSPEQETGSTTRQ